METGGQAGKQILKHLCVHSTPFQNKRRIGSYLNAMVPSSYSIRQAIPELTKQKTSQITEFELRGLSNQFETPDFNHLQQE
jgi:hypothetical protein